MTTVPFDAALAYVRMGWAVFPLHSVRDGKCTCKKPQCKDQGKHPRTHHGFKDASKDPEQIKSWWKQWPDANVGVRTGSESGIWVLDVDKDEDKNGFATVDHLGSPNIQFSESSSK